MSPLDGQRGTVASELLNTTKDCHEDSAVMPEQVDIGEPWTNDADRDQPVVSALAGRDYRVAELSMSARGRIGASLRHIYHVVGKPSSSL